MNAPRVTRYDQALLCSAVTRFDWGVVDLPLRFEQVNDTPLLGRRLFLDYCHLTLEGMQVAVAGIATECIRVLTGRQLAWQTLTATPTVAPAIRATAQFGAAIHCAHRHLPVRDRQELLVYWCKQALASDSAIIQKMRDLIRLRFTPLPLSLTGVQQRNLQSVAPLTLQHGLHYAYRDFHLIAAMQRALVETGAMSAPEVSAWIARWATAQADLSFRDYLAEPLAQTMPDVMQPTRAFYRTPWPTTKLCLVAPVAGMYRLDLTVRLPRYGVQERSQPPSLRLAFNGRSHQRWKVSVDWQRLSCHHTISELGLYWVTLHWPLPQVAGDLPSSRAIQRLQHGWEADIHPIFGEVAALSWQRVG